MRRESRYESDYADQLSRGSRYNELRDRYNESRRHHTSNGTSNGAWSSFFRKVAIVIAIIMLLPYVPKIIETLTKLF